MSQEISNVQVVVLAAFALGADEHPVDLEAIAVQANKLAPGRFTWRTKTDWVNLITVFDCLRDAKKSRSGRLMGGSNETGWYLTKAGIEWAGRHKKLAVSPLAAREKADRKLVKAKAVERSRLAELPAWAKYNAGEAVTHREAEAVFRLSEYARGKRRLLLVDRIQSLFAEDPEMGQFVEDMAAAVGMKGAQIDE